MRSFDRIEDLKNRAPIAPGTYLRLRREAAGLTIAQVAFLLTRNSRSQTDLIYELTACEAGTLRVNNLGLAMQLQKAFPFDLGIWETLAEIAADPGSQLPVPQLCTGCGCSWADHCSWRDPAADICTRCPVPAAGVTA